MRGLCPRRSLDKVQRTALSIDIMVGYAPLLRMAFCSSLVRTSDITNAAATYYNSNTTNNDKNKSSSSKKKNSNRSDSIP